MLLKNVLHFCFSKISRIVIYYAYLCCLNQTSYKSCWFSYQCEEKCVSSYLWGAAEGDKYSNVPLEPSMVTAVSAILLQVASKCSAPTKYSASYLFCTHKTKYVFFSVQVQVQVVG